MAKNYVFTSPSGSVVVTEGEGAAKVIKGPGEQEIDRLIKERIRLGKEISDKLRRHGYVTAGDEATEVIDPGK
jgi:hypothetical protein